MADQNAPAAEPTQPIVSNEAETELLFGSPPVEMAKSEINHSKDVLIHDREYLTSAEIKNSFYHELIRNCAAKLQATQGSSNPAVIPATRMVDLVHKKREGMFVFCCVKDHQAKFYRLTRDQSIQKLSWDLNLRLQGTDALVGSKLAQPKSSELSVPPVYAPPSGAKPYTASTPHAKPAPKPKSIPKQRIINLQKNYALQLIAVVNAAAEKEKPLQAVLILDRPLKLAPGQYYEETDNLRKLRLILRHRFLKAIRSDMTIRNMTKGLLKGWGVPIESLTGAAGNRRRKSLTPASTTADTSTTTQATTTPAPPRGKKSKGSRKNPSDDSPDENCNLGAWTDEEKQLYIEALEQLGWGKWREITAMIPTRCQRQVTSYSRYLGNKVPEVKRGGPLPQAFLDHVYSQKGRRPVMGPDGPALT